MCYVALCCVWVVLFHIISTWQNCLSIIFLFLALVKNRSGAGADDFSLALHLDMDSYYSPLPLRAAAGLSWAIDGVAMRWQRWCMVCGWGQSSSRSTEVATCYAIDGAYEDGAYLFIGEFAIFRVLTHLVPYLKIQRILVNELTSMTPKSKNTCRKLRVSAFKWY